MNINDWLTKFTTSWKQHDLPGVMELFADELEYWETPFQVINDKASLLKQWQVIKTQENIEIETIVFSTINKRSTVLWELSYNKNNEQRTLKGTYLIELNAQGSCSDFHQTCEQE